MGYNIKQKIEICLQSEANPLMTQMDLANWAMQKYNSATPPSQTTISRILSSKNDILSSRESEFLLVRRRKVSNPLLRLVLTEWLTQARWEGIPITTPIIQLTADAIWNKLAPQDKEGNGVFSHKWCNHFVKKLNVNLVGSPEAVADNLGFPLNKVWKLDEKSELKAYIAALTAKKNYAPSDLFTIDEFSLFYCVPLDQIFDVSSIDKGLNDTNQPLDYMLTVMLGCNLDGSEKLQPLVVSQHDTFDVSATSHPMLKPHANSNVQYTPHTLANKISEIYQVSYKYNNNKWITSSIFQDYLLSLDHKLESVSPNRHIAFFLDDSSSHRINNLEFKHIRLIYMENLSKHKNPYNGSFNGVKFDYIPTSFGIVEEFKILYRLQQYLELINKQRNQADSEYSLTSLLNLEFPGHDSESTQILSETDYRIPIIKAIEWIKRSWDSLSPQRIFLAWQKSHILKLRGPWPASDPAVVAAAQERLQPLLDSMLTYDPTRSYEKLKEIMGYLNVVIPWEIDDLLGIVNERTKVSLNYVSIDEMIGSCALTHKKDDNETLQSTKKAKLKQESEPTPKTWPEPEPSIIQESSLERETPLQYLSGPEAFTPMIGQQVALFQDKLPPMSSLSPPTDDDFDSKKALSDMNNTAYRSNSMNALLMATNASGYNSPQYTGPTFSRNVSSSLPPLLKRPREAGTERLYGLGESAHDEKRRAYYGNQRLPLTQTGIESDQRSLGLPTDEASKRPLSNSPFNGVAEGDLAAMLRKVISASQNNSIKLSSFAVEELKYNLNNIQQNGNR